MKVLLERRTAGFTVEVGIILTTGEIILEAKTENYKARVPVLPEQALVAFKHPCSFLPYPDRFFRELKEGEAADETSLPRGGVAVMDASDPVDYCAACTRSLLGHEPGPYCDHCNDDGS
jgi:hypothetical protein